MNTYETVPTQVTAIKFCYSRGGLIELNKFTGGAVTRSGPNRLPTMGGFAYIKLQDNHTIIVDDGNFVVKFSDGDIKNYTPIEFNKFFQLKN